MQYIICVVAVCPIRSEPSHKSEMVSQLLFGETAEILEISAEFIKIKCLSDGYEGWIGRRRVEKISSAEPFLHPRGFVSSAEQYALLNDTLLRLSLGTPVLGDGYFGSQKVAYVAPDLQTFSPADFTPAVINQISRAYLNTPYLWGGKSSFGIDCSGFTQQVFKMFGKNIPRDAYQQATLGSEVSYPQEVRTGDLAFFENQEGKIIHVGIVLTSSTIIHSSAWVRIDQLDKRGILNLASGEYTHRLKQINRI